MQKLIGTSKLIRRGDGKKIDSTTMDTVTNKMTVVAEKSASSFGGFLLCSECKSKNEKSFLLRLMAFTLRSILILKIKNILNDLH